jgi:endonuclease/exonuclease/phosphatase family metal-dependent hydrolase
MRRRALMIVPALLGAALVAPTQAGVATASAAGSASAGQARVSHASYAEARKKKPRKKKKVVLHLPAKPVIRGYALTNGVKVAWGTTHNATRYRVKWSFAPWNYWDSAARYSGWMPISSRSLTRYVSTDAAHDTTMTALPYANPVFMRVQAANKTRLGFLSQWQAVWPAIPRPAAGDNVRFGSYNLMLAGQQNWAARMPVIAQNIANRGLDVLALQETGLNGIGATDLANRLGTLTGHPWMVASTGPQSAEGRIIYDASKYVLNGSGRLNDYSPYGQTIHSYRTGDEINLPWARLTAIGSTRSFVVVSVHFAPSNVSGPNAQANRENGATARAVLAALAGLSDSSEPAVIAGDFAGGYGVWGDQNPAQPVLVRSGWWDSMASLSRSGVNYSTVNKLAPQASTPAVAGRADGIFLRGIHGSLQYQNVANYYMPGTHTPPSDHNLVWSQFQVPN